jgi:iron complex outermembrane receptor protein
VPGALPLLKAQNSAAFEPAVDAARMELDELLSTKVVSVSRTEQRAFTTPAAVHVITSEDIRHSGALNLPDALRLAPGVESFFINSRSWAVTIRGFNGSAANKLLPMIDGRSIYSMRFSGTIWDTQDVMLEDVERIEVIRGPGGTAWGANAVNGVINVITKSAKDTQGTLVSGGGGTFEEAFVEARHGFALGERTWMRVYADAFKRGDSEPIVPADANDAWWQSSAGLRLDSEPDDQRRWLVAGKFFYSEGDQFVGGVPDKARSLGGFIQARYQVEIDEVSRFSTQVYYDGLDRDSGGSLTEADVADAEAQYERTLGSSHHLTFGANYRMNRLFDERPPDGSGIQVIYDPPERWLNQFGAFLQDEWTVLPDRSGVQRFLRLGTPAQRAHCLDADVATNRLGGSLAGRAHSLPLGQRSHHRHPDARTDHPVGSQSGLGGRIAVGV